MPNMPNICGVADCLMLHGIYPESEHQYMAMSDQEFADFGRTMKAGFGFWLERHNGQLYVVGEGEHDA